MGKAPEVRLARGEKTASAAGKRPERHQLGDLPLSCEGHAAEPGWRESRALGTQTASNPSKSPGSALRGSSHSLCTTGSAALGTRGAETLPRDLQPVTRGLKKLLLERSAQRRG